MKMGRSSLLTQVEGMKRGANRLPLAKSIVHKVALNRAVGLPFPPSEESSHARYARVRARARGPPNASQTFIGEDARRRVHCPPRVDRYS
jgi:hypothetical protein